MKPRPTQKPRPLNLTTFENLANLSNLSNFKNPANLTELDPRLERPPYRPEEVGIGHLHLGLGSFFRAHLAVYSDEILAHDRRWGISATSLHSERLIMQLRRQDGLYIVEDGPGRARIIGSLRETLLARQESARLLARLADPGVQVVTLTVTEKGYLLDEASQKDQAAL
ncbi:MAG: hypothetical protein C5B49_06515, partial [Bdellovibrio sp.]